jgi:hypothetical protein
MKKKVEEAERKEIKQDLTTVLSSDSFETTVFKIFE